jgi:hypothetical protein
VINPSTKQKQKFAAKTMMQVYVHPNSYAMTSIICPIAPADDPRGSSSDPDDVAAADEPLACFSKRAMSDWSCWTVTAA